jgi:DNA-binding transcriptional LysR family regulator
MLRFFQQVADGATVTEVAELYQVSQPGVSRGLKRLEEEVGTPLLQRSGRLLRTTHAGSVFKRHVDAVLHALDDGLAAAEELIDPETGTVRVAFQLPWVPGSCRMSSRHSARHPRVRFQFEHSHDALGSSLVADGRTDLEFTARRPRNRRCTGSGSSSSRFCLAVPPDHRLADRGRWASEAARSQMTVMQPILPASITHTQRELCTQAGFVPRVAFEEDDIPVVRGFVAAGRGVAIVPALAAEVRQAGSGAERLVRLTDPGAFREVGLAWSKNRRLLPSAELFHSHVLEGTRAGRLAVR